MKDISLCLFLASLSIYLASSVPITNSILYATGNEIVNTKTMQYPLKITNNLGVLKLDRVYLIESKKYICPQGSVMFAYRDQAGNFRVASSTLDEETSTHDISRAIIEENCEKSGLKRTWKNTKNYMKPTISSQAKTNTDSQYYKPTPNSQSYRPTPNSQSYRPTTTTYPTRDPYDITEDLEENDISNIKSNTANFPAYMFDDKGDAIYGSSLAVTIFTAIIGFIKMLRENRSLMQQLVSAKKSIGEFLKEGESDEEIRMKKKSKKNLSSQPKCSSFNSPRISRNLYTTAESYKSKESVSTDDSQQSSGQNLPGNQPITLNINLPTNLEKENAGSSSNQKEIAQNIVLSNQNNLGQSKLGGSIFCSCRRGNCIKGHCKCFVNKKACTSSCHAGVNPNCCATLEHYKQLTN